MNGIMDMLQGMDPQMLMALLGGQGPPGMGVPGGLPPGLAGMGGIPGGIGGPAMGAQPGLMGPPGGGPPGQGPQGPPGSGQPGQGSPPAGQGKQDEKGMLAGMMQNPQMQMMLVALMAQLMGGNPMLAALLQQSGLGQNRPQQQPGTQTPQGNPFGGMFGPGF